MWCCSANSSPLHTVLVIAQSNTMNNVNGLVFGGSSVRVALFLVIVANLLSVLYFINNKIDDSHHNSDVGLDQRVRRSHSDEAGADDDDVADRVKRVDRRMKTIHVVQAHEERWREFEFSSGFAECPQSKNCKVQVHNIGPETAPISVPNFGHAVVLTAAAFGTQPRAEFWAQVASFRPSSLLWVFRSDKSPFEANVDFLTYRNYNFNLTMTYKPDSDIFTPYGFWQEKSSTNPKLATKNVASNKSRKVLWPIDGACNSVNQRMKYVKELSSHIPVDIIGSCYDHQAKSYRQVDFSTHDGVGRRGVVDDYKFLVAFEEISCRDYVTDVFFKAIEPGNVIPIVMGAQKEAYELLAPDNSYIHIDDFAGPEDLATFLHELDQDHGKYNRYFRYVGSGDFGVPVSGMCRLCDAINVLAEAQSASRVITKADFHDFWSAADCNLNSIKTSSEL